MKIKAIISFCGALTMAAGDVRECSDDAVVSDLLQAGYVVPAGETKSAEGGTPREEEATPKKARRTKKS